MTRLVVGTAGHIDHGKSALVQALTGIDPDRLKEEKARGITIELGFAHTSIEEAAIAFVDVPGHERFVRTMLAGVGGIDFVVLVVAADESVMPQTREHFDICRLLGVRDGCVAVTKADVADAETRALVALEVADLVRGSFLDGKPVVTVSARTGEGLDVLKSALADAARRSANRPADGVVRLPVDRTFSVHGFGTVVTGTLVSGRVTVGQGLVLLPSERAVKVRGIQVHGRAVDTVVAGQRTALNLSGVEVADVPRGQTLTSSGALSVTRRVDVDVELLPDVRPLKHGVRVRVHHGTAEVLSRLSLAGGEMSVEGGAAALGRLRLELPAVSTRGDRLILRSYSPAVTIGAATVLDPAPTTLGIRSPQARQRLEVLRTANPVEALGALVRERGLRGVPVAHAVARTGLAPAAVSAAIDELRRTGGVVQAGDRLVGTEALSAAGRTVVTLAGGFHAQHPLSEGIPREEVRVRAFRGVDAAVFERVLSQLVQSGALVDRERLALPSHRAAVPGGEDTVAAVETAFRAGGLTPPDMATVAAELSLTPAAVEAAVAYLIRQKHLLKLGGLAVHQAALVDLKSAMAEWKAAGGGTAVHIDVGQFKDRYGVTRKFAIPLLEYLDRERVTRRIGDARVLL